VLTNWVSYPGSECSGAAGDLAALGPGYSAFTCQSACYDFGPSCAAASWRSDTTACTLKTETGWTLQPCAVCTCAVLVSRDPSLSGLPCDASGSCYYLATGALNWAAALATCAGLGSGWSLASIVDDASAASVAGGTLSCGGAGGGGGNYWTGLRAIGGATASRLTSNWSWAVPGLSTAYFYANNATLWGTPAAGQPAPTGAGACVDVLTPGYFASGALNDDNCVVTMGACCAWRPRRIAACWSPASPATCCLNCRYPAPPCCG
jgi:hypothetical protein